MTDERIDKLTELASKAQASEQEARRRIARLERELAALASQKREIRRLLDRAAAIAQINDSVAMAAIIRTIIEVASV